MTGNVVNLTDIQKKEIIDRLEKIELSLKKNELKAIIYTNDSNSFIFESPESLDQLNEILDDYTKKTSKELSELIKDGIITKKSSTIDKYYTFGTNKISRVEHLDINAIVASNVSQIVLQLDARKALVGEIKFKDGTTKKINNVGVLNAILDIFYNAGVSDINGLIKLGLLTFNPPKDNKIDNYYESIDQKHFTKKVKTRKKVLISKIDLDLQDDGKLVGKVSYTNGTTSTIIDNLADINIVLNALCNQDGKSYDELVTDGKIIVADDVKKKYDIINGTVKTKSDAKVEKVELSLKDKKLVGKVTYSDSHEEELVDYYSVNDFNQRFIASEKKSFEKLVADGIIVVADDVKTEYDNIGGFFSPKITKIELDLAPDNTLIGTVTYSDSHKDNLTDASLISGKIKDFTDQEGVSRDELVKRGKITISDAAKKEWDKIVIEKGDSSSSKLAKWVKNLKISKKGLIILTSSLAGIVIITVGLGEFARQINKNKSSDGSRTQKSNISEESNDIDTTHNMGSDEEVVEALSNSSYYDGDSNVQYGDDGVPFVHEYVPSDLVAHDVESLGSAVIYDTMETQLGVIDNYAVKREVFQFENLVVNDDYDAIYALNNMRSKAINGQISNRQYMDALVNYIYYNNTYVDGNFIERFDSLHPFAKYIIVRMGQGQLLVCRDYNNENGIDFSTLNDYFRIEGDELYNILTQGQYTNVR